MTQAPAVVLWTPEVILCRGPLLATDVALARYASVAFSETEESLWSLLDGQV